MQEIDILKNIVKDYSTQILDVEEEIAKAQKWLSQIIRERNMLRNNMGVVLDLIEEKTNIKIDKNLYSDLDDLSEYDNND